jgi:hypothetical protein
MVVTLQAHNPDGPPFVVNLRFAGSRLIITCSCPVKDSDQQGVPCSHIDGVLAGEIDTLVGGADPEAFASIQTWIATAGRLNH